MTHHGLAANFNLSQVNGVNIFKKFTSVKNCRSENYCLDK